jgi:hypothetical protein
MRAMPTTARSLIVMAAALALLAGCGSSSSSSMQSGTGTAAEARSAATGDIPDNQVFLTYRDRAVGYSLTYPEGWTRIGGGRRLAFRDKGNSVTLAVVRAAPVAPHGGRSGPQRVKLKHGSATKATYTRIGPPDPVTGKRPLLVIDRYVYSRPGGFATLDLATPRGVDNVDAYRMIANSFQWR